MVATYVTSGGAVESRDPSEPCINPNTEQAIISFTGNLLVDSGELIEQLVDILTYFLTLLGIYCRTEHKREDVKQVIKMLAGELQ